MSNTMSPPIDGLEIPVPNLDTQHRLLCTDGEWRQVTRVDYIYDVDASITSKTFAVAYCEGDHRQLVKNHVYIYNPTPASSPHPSRASARETPKKNRKSKVPASGEVPPDEVA